MQQVCKRKWILTGAKYFLPKPEQEAPKFLILYVEQHQQ
jgi:hypothetical protein